MAANKPVLGYVPCTNPDCNEQMEVKTRKSGRGGLTTSLMGYCKKCRKLEQAGSSQEYLKQYAQTEPLNTVEQQQSGNVDGFDVAEISDKEPEAKPVNKTIKTGKHESEESSSGGGVRLFIGVLAIIAVSVGAGALIKN